MFAYKPADVINEQYSEGNARERESGSEEKCMIFELERKSVFFLTSINKHPLPKNGSSVCDDV